MKTTYKVKAAGGFRNYAKGAEFEADLDPFIEQWAIDQKLIEPVTKGKEKGKEKADG